jgi:O-glycosyl hydrolase
MGRGGLDLAASIHHALVDGGCSAFVYWAITDPEPSSFALMGLDKPTPKYAALKQFAEFIPPGAVRIEVTPPDSTILASAYFQEERKSLTVVFVNQSASDVEVTIEVRAAPSGLPVEFEGARSSSTEMCQAIPRTIYDGQRPFKLKLSRQSVTTLRGVMKSAQPVR